MRAKVKCQSVTLTEHGEDLEFVPVPKPSAYPEDGLDEDNTYAKFSPSGSFKISVRNPELFGKFKPGDKFYVDFTESA